MKLGVNMHRVQQIQKAKSYLDLLSQAIDPTTGEAIEENVLQKQQIKEVFSFISSVLEELIANNGEVVCLETPMAFQPESINKELVTISDKPILVIGLVSRINKQVNKRVMQHLGYSKINNWLLQNGYLVSEKVSVVKQETKYSATEKAHTIGILSSDKVNEKTGEISPCVLLSAQAQKFLIQNLETILTE